MVDVAVGVTATVLFKIPGGCAPAGLDASALCGMGGNQVFRKHGFGYVGMLLGVWGSTWPAHGVCVVCGCGCLVGLHVNDHCAVCGVWLLWCGCVV